MYTTVSTFSRFLRNFAYGSFPSSSMHLGDFSQRHFGFVMTASISFSDNSDSRSSSFYTHLARKFAARTFTRSVGRIISEVKISAPHTDNTEDLMILQKGLRLLWTCRNIHGGHKPKPFLNCLRFVPHNTHISLSRLCGIENHITDGASAGS